MIRRPLLALPLLMVGAWIISSFIAKEQSAVTILTVLTVILSILSFFVLYFLYSKDKPLSLMLLPVCFIVCLIRFTLYDIKTNNWLENADINLSQIEVGASGKITKVEEKNDNTYIYIENAVIRANNECVGVILLINGQTEIKQGMEIEFAGSGSLLPEPTNPGQFDSRNYYLAKGIAYRLINPEIQVVKQETIIDRILYNIRTWLELSIDMNADAEDAGIFKAMLLGSKGEVSEETKSLYQSGGISHILAISGLHVSFIGFMIFGIFRFIGFRIGLSSVLASVITLLYALMVGAPVSAIRAVIMLIISLSATAAGRTYDMPSSLSVSWVITGLIYPLQLTQSGFQLSFGAIIAFSFIAPEINELLGYMKKRRFRGKPKRITVWGNKLESGLVGSLAVSTVTWPVIAWHMYVITPVSILYNLLVIPCMSLVMGNIIVASLIGCFNVAGILPSVSVIWLPAHFVLKLYEWICSLTSIFKFGQIVTGRPLVISIILYSIFYIILLIVLKIINFSLEKKRDFVDFSGQKWDELYKLKKLGFRMMTLLLICVLQLTGLVILKRPRQESTIVFADVGQGDGTVYFSGDTCIGIDGGSSFLEGIGQYRLEPLIMYMGYQNVDAWFISHPDNDHVSGIIELMSDANCPIDIKELIIPQASYGDNWKAVDQARGQIPVIQVKAGDELSFGDNRVEILYPAATEGSKEVNDLCLVFMLKTKKTRVLFCGDISSDIEKVLISRYESTYKLKANILKVAHHGSKYSSCTEFLEAVSAELAVISVGKNNYGHPTKEVLDRLSQAQMLIYITMEKGAFIKYI